MYKIKTLIKLPKEFDKEKEIYSKVRNLRNKGRRWLIMTGSGLLMGGFKNISFNHLKI